MSSVIRFFTAHSGISVDGWMDGWMDDLGF